MAVTQQDIAQKIGVSRRLVGYALNDDPCVGAEMRQRINDLAIAMGYRTNRAAQALRTGRTNQIALCFPFLGSTFNNEIIRQFEMLAKQSAYELLVNTYNPDNPNERRTHFTVDGMIFVSPANKLPDILSHPVIAVQNQMERAMKVGEEEIDRVQINTEKVALEVMNHLLEQGFRRIAYAATKPMMDPEDFRYLQYQRAMADAGLTPELITIPIPGEELIRVQSHQALKSHFEKHGFPEALFCCNDDIGIGAYGALQDLGRSIPDETAVIGFDDLDFARYLTPRMSSVHMPIAEACQKAWGILMKRIEDDALSPQFESYDACLVVRESSVRKS